jgi:segregation and condensation protein B
MAKPERVVEAALFSAGRPVSVEELQEATGLEPELIRQTMHKLMRSSRNRDTSVEVVKAGGKYAMQLKAELVPAAAKLAQMDIPRRLLKTLALIAYHQPIKQSALQDMVGPKVYDHVKDLHKLGMILESPQGQTKILSTSSRFPEYFGIKTTKREDIKKWMAEKIGIKVDGSASGASPAPEIMAQKTIEESAAGEKGGAKGEEAAETGDGTAAKGEEAAETGEGSDAKGKAGAGKGAPPKEGSAEEE